MIIYAAQPGQLGNSLIIYANILAFATENKMSFYYPGFYPYKNYFEFTANKKQSRFTFKAFNILARALARLKFRNVVSIDWNENVNLDTQKLKAKHGTHLYLGWNYRGNNNLHKYKETITRCFTPAPSYRTKLDDFFKSNFTDDRETIVGIHIRRGDYSWFEGGKYFYSIEQYKTIIRRIHSLFNDTKIRFLIASNEKLSLEMFSDVPAKITLAPGQELLDMYAFAKCSYIAGPPSTYTMWASFYGNVPLYMLHNINEEFTLKDFKIQTSF